MRARQILVHCNGDAAADQYISAYRAALDEVGEEVNIRPVMIHAQTLRPDDQLDEVQGAWNNSILLHCPHVPLGRCTLKEPWGGQGL